MADSIKNWWEGTPEGVPPGTYVPPGATYDAATGKPVYPSPSTPGLQPGISPLTNPQQNVGNYPLSGAQPQAGALPVASNLPAGYAPATVSAAPPGVVGTALAQPVAQGVLPQPGVAAIH